MEHLVSREAPPGVNEDRYTLADALGVATFLNIFLRACRIVGMANYALLVNVSAPIITGPDKLLFQPTYHVLRLYSEFMRGTVLDTYVECETYELRPEAELSSWPHRIADLAPFNLLDVTTVYSREQRALTVAVINRDREKPHTSSIRLTKAIAAGIEVYELNAADPDCMNTFENLDAVIVQKRSYREGKVGRHFTCTFAPHSLTFLRMRLAPQA